MVAWTRMATYEEDVDSERMHLDEGRGYELSIVFDAIRRDAAGGGRTDDRASTPSLPQTASLPQE